MNSIHNNGPDDKELNDELEELGNAYQQHSSEEPPELLDQAILNHAHRAVEKEDHWLDFGWVHGLTTAAVVVLALSIILTQYQPVGLEENGISPVDASSAARSRLLELELRDETHQQRSNEMEQKKQELSKEVSRKVRKDAGQVMPAASAPETQAGALAEAIPARDAPPSTVGFADELSPAEAPEVEIDAVKSDADKIVTERSQSTTEEEQVQAILMMKNAGDIRWETELKIFIENHPDYPLPDELKN